MHPRVRPPAAPARPSHALRGLVCLLLLGWASKPATARLKAAVRATPAEPSAPYLRALGPLPIRFQPTPPVAEPVARPAASGPPLPADSSASPASAPAIAAEHAPATADVSLVPVKPVAPVTPPIIPDDTRPRVQPEDFLPFFQFPTAGDAPVILPPNPPHHATPSTATYRQQ